MRKILGILVAVLAPLALVVTISVPAYADNGPFDYCTHNGNTLCFGDVSLPSPGDPMTEWANGSGNARDVSTESTGGQCTDEINGAVACGPFYIKFYNSDLLRSTDSCTNNVYIGSPTDSTGIIWDLNVFADNTIEWSNQHCAGMGSILYSDNTSGDRWHIDGGGVSMHYYKVDDSVS